MPGGIVVSYLVITMEPKSKTRLANTIPESPLALTRQAFDSLNDQSL